MDAAFINTDQLKKLGLINGNVEDSDLRVIIQRAQVSEIQPLIGTSLYNRISTGIDDNDLNTDERLLMDDYIIPLMVVLCDRRAINVTTYQIRNKTTGKGVDENITPVTESENLRLDNQIRHDTKVPTAKLVGYLLDNCDLYPEYDSEECNYENIRPQKKKSSVRNIRFR